MAPKEKIVKVRSFPSAAHWLQSAAHLFLCSIAAAAMLAAVGAFGAERPANLMDGVWMNADPASRGLVMIEVAGNKIHPYGKCHPQACDWGVLKAKLFAASVDTNAPAALRAKATPGFATEELMVTLEPDGRLRVEVFTHFTDGSGRADYRAVDYFVRGRQPYMR